MKPQHAILKLIYPQREKNKLKKDSEHNIVSHVNRKLAFPSLSSLLPC